ncbi:hypothetical protein ACFLV7_07040 [Chloroflexota bacterium]
MTRKIKFSFIVLFTALSIVFLVVPVMATPPLPPQDVQIVDAHNIPGGTGEFTASGPAVDEGLMCASGDVADLNIQVVAPPGGTFRILRVLKQFTCDGLSGTFDVKLLVRLDLITHETTANWNVVGGDGDYVGLHGNGKLIGIPIVPGESIIDIYNGKMH